MASRRSTRKRPARRRSQTRAPQPSSRRPAVLYARVSSRDQEREGFSIPAQQTLLRDYAATNGFEIVEEFVDVETAKRTGRTSFNKMVAFIRKRTANRPTILVEKTDRLYRNLKDWVTIDELGVEVHLVKE
ncbi:MAG: recombinase family protein, partial [Deltaproteobacteria bacterium]